MLKKEFDEIFKEKDFFEHIYFYDEEKENSPVDLYNSLNGIFQQINGCERKSKKI